MVVMEIGYDVPAGDREPWEEHITRCSRDMRGGTRGDNKNLQSRGVYVEAGGVGCQIEVTCSGVGNGCCKFW